MKPLIGVVCWLAGQMLVTETMAQGDAAPKVTIKEDVVYGRVHGAALVADLAYPESKEPLPAIVSVHGGRWVGGHKKDASTIKVEQWAGFGFWSMSIDYRLKGTTPAPACYQDFQCAIRYVHAHAKEFNLDTNRIFLIGQSAGGHMTSLAATLGDGTFPRTGGWEKTIFEPQSAWRRRTIWSRSIGVSCGLRRESILRRLASTPRQRRM